MRLFLHLTIGYNSMTAQSNNIFFSQNIRSRRLRSRLILRNVTPFFPSTASRRNTTFHALKYTTCLPGRRRRRNVSAVHKPVSAAHKPVSATHKPVSAVHKPVSAAHKPVSAVHKPVSAECGIKPDDNKLKYIYINKKSNF
jgi:hypothetical protein